MKFTLNLSFVFQKCQKNRPLDSCPLDSSDSYNQQEQLFFVQILYEEDISAWFGSNYLPAFSALQAIIYHTSTALKYDILTVAGVDDNDNPIEATGRVDYLPK